jgi:hypothetical protein
MPMAAGLRDPFAPSAQAATGTLAGDKENVRVWLRCARAPAINVVISMAVSRFYAWVMPLDLCPGPAFRVAS